MGEGARVISLANRHNRCAECPASGECLTRDFDHPELHGRYDIAVTPRVLHRGDHLFRAGEQFNAIYKVRSGAVKTYLISPCGDEQVIGFHGPGDLVGLDGIGNSVHACGAQVLDTSSVCALPFDQLTRLSSRSPTVYRRLLNCISHKMVHDETMLLVLGHMNAEQRIARFLLEWGERLRSQGFSASEVNLPMSRTDIASYLALAVETVSRVLTRLQETGVLSVHRNRIEILEPVLLGEIAGEEVTPAPQAYRAR